MRRIAGLLIATLALVGLGATSVSALPVIAGSPPLVDGPLLITKYSFQGDHVRFVEIYNATSGVVDLAGWRVMVARPGKAEPELLAELHGLLAPRTWVTVGDRAIFDPNQLPTFAISYQIPVSTERLTALALYPSADSYLPHVVTPTITGSTVSLPAPVPTEPPLYGFGRNISTTTGNYSSSAFTATVPDENFLPYDDGLYVPPDGTSLQIVEIYPNPVNCSPLETFATRPICFDYVKLYNPTDTTVDLGAFRVHGAGTARLDALIPKKSYVALPLTLNNSGWVWIEDRYGVTPYQQTLLEYPDSGGSHRGQAWSLDGATWRWTAYPMPYDTPNQFTDGSPLNDCASLRLSEIGANTARQFIEVYNASAAPIDVGGCQLLTNRSTDKKYIFAGQQLAAAASMTVDIAKTDLVLTKTTTGTVYVLSSDGLVEVDARTYENLSDNTSLALVDGVWRQTFSPTPGDGNVYTEYPPCQSGYQRNLTTGRCNKIVLASGLLDCGVGRERNPETGRCRAVTATSQLAPCQPGQVRNPATNRCRSTTLAASALTPCREGQERNPATNRCRAVLSAATTLQPCAAGQERNPETNRCRKIAVASAGDAAPFAVEPIADTGRAFAAWWALGGVLLLGAGYGVWEWRHEISRSVRQIMTRSKIDQ